MKAIDTRRQVYENYRYDNVLKAFGLASEFSKLKPMYRKALKAISFPELEIRSDIENDENNHQSISMSLKKEVAKRNTYNGLCCSISIRDYMSIALSFAHAGKLFYSISKNEKKVRQFIDTAKILILNEDLVAAVCEELIKCGERAVSKCCFIDKQIYGLSYIDNEYDERGFSSKYFQLHRQIQKCKAICNSSNGQRRMYYLCSSHKLIDTGDGINNVFWTKECCADIPNKCRLPVYISTHALLRLEERMMGGKIFHKYMLHDYLWSSMKSPNIIKKGEREYLVEYTINGYKFGYIPVVVTAQGILASTFIFLTMDGTPEGDKLYSLLRINKNDKKYISWDKLSTFIDSDLREDEWARKQFRECGCDQLFKYGELCKVPVQDRGYSKLAHKYFGM